MVRAQGRPHSAQRRGGARRTHAGRRLPCGRAHRTSEFPDLDEAPVSVLDVAPVMPPTTAQPWPGPSAAAHSPRDRSSACAMQPIACARPPARAHASFSPISARRRSSPRARRRREIFCGRRHRSHQRRWFANHHDMIWPSKARARVSPASAARAKSWPATRPALRRHSRARACTTLSRRRSARPRGAVARRGRRAFIHRGCDAIAILRAAHEQMAGSPPHQRVADQEQQEPRSELSERDRRPAAIWCG